MFEKIISWFKRLFHKEKPAPEPKNWVLPDIPKKARKTNLSRKRSYCWRCAWGELRRGNYLRVFCRKRGKIYGQRKLERGTIHCHEESRIRTGNIVIQPKEA